MTGTRPMHHRLDRIEAARERILGRLDSLTEAQLRESPAAGGWSALEIVEHLVLAEASVLRGAGEPENLRVRRLSLRSLFGFLVVLGVLSAPVPVKVPSRSMKPSGGRPLAELREAWEESHGRLRRHLASVDAGQVTGAVFAHPVSGALTTRQAFKMLEVHLKRHERQLDAVLKAVGAQPPSDGS